MRFFWSKNGYSFICNVGGVDSTSRLYGKWTNITWRTVATCMQSEAQQNAWTSLFHSSTQYESIYTRSSTISTSFRHTHHTRVKQSHTKQQNSLILLPTHRYNNTHKNKVNVKSIDIKWMKILSVPCSWQRHDMTIQGNRRHWKIHEKKMSAISLSARIKGSIT